MENGFYTVLIIALFGVGIFLTLRPLRLLNDLGFTALAVAVLILLFWSGVIWSILTLVALVFIIFYAFRLMITGRWR